MPIRESPLRAELEAAMAVKNRFDTAYAQAVSSGDLSEAEQLKAELTEKMNALKEKLNPFEARLHVREQYESQVRMLARVGILETLKSGQVGITGVDGKEYQLPSLQEVTRRMVEKREMIQTKVDQGFEKLLLVPFGMSLDQLIAKYKAALQKHFDEKKLFYTKKDLNDKNEALEPIPELHNEGPLYVWDKYQGADTNGALVYYPTEFSATHGAKTKEELLADEEHGFTIRLIENLPNIPRQGQGKTVGSTGNERAQLDTGGTSIQKARGESVPSPREYLKALQTDTQYQHEQGMTPEEQILYALAHLEETNEVIDDYRGKGSISYQLGAYFPASGIVPSAYWRRDFRQAYLDGHDPDIRYDNCGARFVVGV